MQPLLRSHESMTLFPRAFLLLAAALLPACALLPLSDPDEGRNPQDPQFDADYYAQNAKEYFDGDQFLRAREQWEQQLKLQPGNWMAQIGIASCDFHLGSLALDRGEIRYAEDRLGAAHKAAAALWDGKIEADAAQASNIPVAQWKAALVVAMAARGLSDCDTLRGRMENQRSASLGPQDPARQTLATSAEKLGHSAATRRAEALQLFLRLDAMGSPTPEATLNVAELQVASNDAASGESSFRRWLQVSTSAREFWQKQLEQCEQEPDQRVREAKRAVVNQKIQSVRAKRAAVLVRLGNIAYDQGEALLTTPGAQRDAKQHFSRAVDDLNGAMEAEPARMDVLVKLAQCQGRLGQFELATNNLERYIRTRSEQADSWDENLNTAFRLKAEFAAHLKKPPQ